MINRNGTAWVYSYDYENRLTKVTHSGSTIQLNYYDGDGNRIKQTTTDSVVYSYQGVDILYEKDTTTGTVTKHFYAGQIEVAKLVGASAYYLHQDALGSTRLTMTATVNVSFSSNYVPYGPNFGETGSETYQYTGKLIDSVTGLYYEGARYYDPTTGRFITQDSVVGTRVDPQSLNRYVYARDNPMKIVDLVGHEWWNPVADLAAATSDVVGGATNIANAVSNAWNSLPPDVQTGIIIGAAAGATVAAVVTLGAAAPLAAVVDTSAISSIGIGAVATGGVAATAEAVPEFEPDFATIAGTIDEGFLNGAIRNAVKTLSNPGPEPDNSQAVGAWGQKLLEPILKQLGFTTGKVIDTPIGKLFPDFFNPETGMTFDAKVGVQTANDFEETQMAKYALGRMSGQISGTVYGFLDNPWNGNAMTNGNYLDELDHFGILYHYLEW